MEIRLASGAYLYQLHRCRDGRAGVVGTVRRAVAGSCAGIYESMNWMYAVGHTIIVIAVDDFCPNVPVHIVNFTTKFRSTVSKCSCKGIQDANREDGKSTNMIGRLNCIQKSRCIQWRSGYRGSTIGAHVRIRSRFRRMRRHWRWRREKATCGHVKNPNCICSNGEPIRSLSVKQHLWYMVQVGAHRSCVDAPCGAPRIPSRTLPRSSLTN